MGAQAELIVPYDPDERKKYEERDGSSIFHQNGYSVSLWHGIYKRGRFPEVAVRASLKALGFSVLISDPGMPTEGGYILTHYAGKRRRLDAAFQRMFQWFPEALITDLNRECDDLKRSVSGNRGGGDPDLFVFSEAGDRFFVEVKDKDEIKEKQRATFASIARILGCDVLMARVKAESGARPGDGLRLVSRPANTRLQPTALDPIVKRRLKRHVSRTRPMQGFTEILLQME
ncbi:MAG: hypothetical protein ABI868_07810 [Acidobacteriota bacterium]